MTCFRNMWPATPCMLIVMRRLLGCFWKRCLSLVYEGKEHEYFQIPTSMWNSTLHTRYLHQEPLGSGCHFHICAHEHTLEVRPQGSSSLV